MFCVILWPGSSTLAVCYHAWLCVVTTARSLQVATIAIADPSGNGECRPAPPQHAERLQGPPGSPSLHQAAPPSSTSSTPILSDESIAAAFSKYDVSGMGSIPVECLAQLMATLGCPLTPAQTRQAVQQLDRASSGSVAYGQFLLWWRG